MGEVCFFLVFAGLVLVMGLAMRIRIPLLYDVVEEILDGTEMNTRQRDRGRVSRVATRRDALVRTDRVTVRGSRRIRSDWLPTDFVAVAMPAAPRELVVDREDLPLWQEKGWRRNGGGYEGSYSVNGSSWKGRIEEPYTDRYEIHILRPPRELRRHPKWHCIWEEGDGWYFVHTSREPRNLDDAIVGIERMLSEALGNR